MVWLSFKKTAVFLVGLSGSVVAQNVLPISLREADINDWVLVISTVSVAIAVLMLIFFGLKWMTADGPDDRREAKEGIKNVLYGLLILIIAAAIVTFMDSIRPHYA